MCGILGAIYFKGQQADANTLLRAAQWMKHRGPDDEGVWTKGSVGFAHKRLSILDLTLAGHQPMMTANGQAVIVYNGECYNFQELRQDLETKGYQFRSRTDTEVILYGIQEYGASFVNRMNGMFAFAVWLEDAKEVLLFRDRLGVKPVYIYQDLEKFYFSSEIKPLLSLGIKPELEESAVSSFFSLRYCPGEKTFFKFIKKLAPGHFLRIKQNGEIGEHEYWSLSDSWQVSDLSLTQAKEKFFHLLDSSVSLRQIADVQVGAFLSGGIDSSAIVALMRKNEPNVESFTIGMGGDIDESQAAKRVADFVGIKNDTFSLQQDDYRFYEKALWHLEEPIGDSIIVPTYLLAKRAAQRLKVIELGEGADEILGGYVHQYAMTYGNLLKKSLPGFIFQLIPQMMKILPQVILEKVFPYPAKLGSSGTQKIIQYLQSMDNLGTSYLNLVGLFGNGGKQNIFCEDFYQNFVRHTNPASLFSDFFAQQKNPVFQNRLLALDLRFWNADYTLLRMDKLTMAHSLEARVPYLDYRLVEFCLSLPRSFKTKSFEQKVLLRKALSNKKLLPREVIKAPKKAFYLPIEKCFDHRFQEYVRDTLSADSVKKRKIFNVEYIQKMLDQSDRELIGNKEIMVLLIFELWARMFLDGNWQK
jgi:asparagine synthase (glutamine-hydrolysing)